MNRCTRISLVERPLASAFTALTILTAGFGSARALADEPVPYERGETLMVRYHCAACHAAYDPSTAPSLHAIADKYAVDPTAQQELETMVLNGSAGVWGTDSAMSANDVPRSDLHTLVEWILSLR